MSDRLTAAFDICLQALTSGASPEACLHLYPDLAEELRPALMAAQSLIAQEPGRPSPAAQAGSRHRTQSLAADARSRHRRQVLRQPLPRLGFALAAVALALVAGWGGLTAAAAQSLPGETLYPVKRADETLRLKLVRNERARQTLRLTFNSRREAEARALIDLGRSGPVSFEGVLEEQAPGAWTVSSLPIAIDPATRIIGTIDPGDSVIITGTTRPAGDILASEVSLHTYQLTGLVEQMAPAAWQVAGQPLRILPTSQVQTGIQIGDPVLVLVEVQPDGEHDAQVILSMALGPDMPDNEEPEIEPSASPVAPEATATTASERVEFTGIVEDHQGSIWWVAGRILLQTSESEIRGEILPGDHVLVRAQSSATGGLILERIERTDPDSSGEPDGDEDDEAEEAEAEQAPIATPTDDPVDSSGDDEPDEQAEETRFSGTITSIGSTSWVVGGRSLKITDDTRIDDDLEVGDEAEVRALRFQDGHLEALRIEAAD